MKGKTKSKIESLTSWFFFINSDKYELLLKSEGYNGKKRSGSVLRAVPSLLITLCQVST